MIHFLVVYYEVYFMIHFSVLIHQASVFMSEWHFLTSHAQVLLCISQEAHVSTREIAGVVGITERAVQGIIADLQATGYITKTREGRKNRYRISKSRPMRHPAQRGHAIRELLELLGK